MDPVGFLEICEFLTIVGLNNPWYISEVTDSPVQEIYRGERRMILVSLDKPFPGSLIYDCELIITIVVPHIGVTFSRDVLHVQLHLFTH